jgi:hypothetical protein
MNQNWQTKWTLRACAAFVVLAASAIDSPTLMALRSFDLADNDGSPTEVVQETGGQNLIVNGAFGMGNTGFVSQYVFGNDTNPGTYVIGTEPCLVPGHYFDWQCFSAHNGPGYRMFIANGGNSASETVWTETVDIAPETRYAVTFWGATINTSSSSPAQLALEINGQVLGSVVLPASSPVTGGSWVSLSGYWNSGSSTTATLVILDKNTATDLNDFVLDDISLVESPDSDEGGN